MDDVKPESPDAVEAVRPATVCKLLGPVEVSRHRFVLHGVEVEELICVIPDEGGKHLHKMLWYRPPLDKMSVDGMASPMAHTVYQPDGPNAFELKKAARRRVSRRFVEYYAGVGLIPQDVNRFNPARKAEPPFPDQCV